MITEVNLREFFVLSQKLQKTNFIPGFIRYEVKSDDNYQYLIDFHPGNATARYGPFWMRVIWLKNFIIKNSVIFKKIIFDETTYFEPDNLHSGCFALTREQFKRVLGSGDFFKGPEGGFCGILESAASDVYFRCGFTKVIRLDSLEKLLVHHLPNKYVLELAKKYKYNKIQVPNPNKLIKMVNDTSFYKKYVD